MEDLPQSLSSLPVQFRNQFERAITANHDNLDLSEVPWEDEHLNEVPYCLVETKQFRSIDLSGNKIFALPSWLNSLSSVENIDITGNPLKEMDASLSLNLSIDSNQWLHMKDSLVNCNIVGFTLLPEDKEHFPDITTQSFYSSLKTLSMNNCEMTDWPTSWPEKLQGINLHSNQLSDWPTSWPEQLQHINLNNNQLSEWPTSWPEQLQHIFLMNNQLSDWPTSWPEQLQHIFLMNNQLSDWPTSWPKQLQTILLNNNQLSEWPTSWPEQLKQIDLDNNQLSDWPNSWPESLQRINLDNNQLSEWPTSWPEQLKQIDLDNNQLSDWPTSWPKQLQTILLNNNQLSDWPTSWPEQLQHIYLMNNQLSEWPTSWPEQLQRILLNNNQLSEWPTSWPEQLQSINLDNNQLSSWPTNWPGQLQTIRLNNNQLSDWPTSWPNLPNLKTMSLSGNGLGEDVDALDNRNIEALKKLFERSADRIFINEAKLLIVGEPASGKTSLMRKLADPTHLPTPNTESTTEGINIAQWEFFDQDEHSTPFTANIWDFGGQEIQYATHKFFLTERAVYVVVADNRAQKTNFDYWLRIINFLGKKDSKVIVFLHDKENASVTNFNESEYHKKFPDFAIKNFHANLANENRNEFSVLQDAIQQSLTTLPFLKEKVDKAWLDVKQHIEALRDQGCHDLGYQALTDICAKYGLANSEVDPLAKYLNWMGVIIYFENDHSSLRDFIIIDPEWAVNPIYQVLKHDVVKKEGVFEESFFFNLLDDSLYNPAQKGHLLTLLTKDHFEICYPISERDGHYVVPMLLPETPNRLDIENHPKTQSQPLQYEFEYRFLPKGLFARLIIRHFTEIAKDNAGNQYVWRSGVLFNADNCAVEVLMEDEIDKVNGVIRIRVYGAEHQRRNALLKFRAEIQKLNRDLSKSLEGEVQEKVPCICDHCSVSDKPEYYSLGRLENNLNAGKSTVECGKSGRDILISELIEDVVPKHYEPSLEELEHRENQFDLLDGIELLPSHKQEFMQQVDKKIEDRLQQIQKLAVATQPINFNITNTSQANASNTNNISINIEVKNEHCCDMLGFLDEMKDLLTNNANATAEIEKAEQLVNQINDSEKIEKGKLSRLKGIIDKIKNGTSEVGKLMESIQGLKEPASNLIDGYNVIAPLIGVPSVSNFLK
ncbi:COR domain-containing protein [Marinomonas gallaica]|uniref:COR domain-containing protein n=1 Tax=Marinomonas gallaica TaxID=1806667 RepID=UPI003A8CBFCB